MAPITVEITPDTVWMAEDTADLIPSQAEITISLQFSQMNRNGRVMMSTAPCMMEPKSITAVCTTLQMPSHTPCRCVHRLENHVFKVSTIEPIPLQTVFHRFPNHSVMAPQFWMMAMIPAMAAATAAMMPMMGSMEIFNAPIATEMAAITGVSAVNAARSAPRMMTKFCTGPGRRSNHPPMAVITETRDGRMALASPVYVLYTLINAMVSVIYCKYRLFPTCHVNFWSVI